MENKFRCLFIPFLFLVLINNISFAQHYSTPTRKYPGWHHPPIARVANTSTSNASAVSLQTVRCLGGSGDEGAFSGFMTQTNDGGFILGTYSSSTDGDVSGNHGGIDAWVIKMNASGIIQWKKNYGGSGDDFVNSVIQTNDGGYIFIGYTYSNDGDVSGNHGEGDVWIVKLNANGNISWQKCYGGSGDEFAYYGIIQTSDGGYAAIGSSASRNGEANGNHGGYDVLVLKLSSTGNIQWSKTYGGSSDEYGNLIVQNSDGTYTISADTYSTNGNINGNHGALDTWVARLNTNGNIIWKKCFGGSAEEFNASLITTSDGNILFGDYTGSNDGDVTGNHQVIPNGGDMWLVKLNRSNGSIIWTKTLGGSNGGPRPSLPDYPDDEVALFINETAGGEFLVAGGSTSSDGDLTVNRGVGDCWILKLDNTGNIIWQKSFGGSDEDAATAIFPSANGGYIVAGWTYSGDYDFKKSGQHGEGDIFIARFAAENGNNIAALSINKAIVNGSNLQSEPAGKLNAYPNPFTNSTTISFSLSQLQKISFKVFDMSGRLVNTIADRFFESGEQQITWNTNDVKAGIYLLRMESANYSETKKLVVIK
jgi:hypothetical protein